ncbi:sensor histidine kinase [Nonomuraea sp. NPDC050547]|uniref:sensor histidine kinase n=1 Tax=Nonomuraea sp. NPDC050547 TaxID=3364368 RepID=UPI0037AEFBEB
MTPVPGRSAVRGELRDRVRRLVAWLGRHPLAADASPAGIACAYLLIEVPYSEATLARIGSVPLTFWGDLAAFACLALRRRWPLGVLAAVWVLWLAVGRWDVWAEVNASWAELGASTALQVAFYTVGRWRASPYHGLLLLGVLVPAGVMSALVCALPWGAGVARRRWVVAAADAEEGRARAMVAEERVRIARELHDIVAHNVSAMVIQSHVAVSALAAEDHGPARTSLESIRESGQAALTELRLLLGGLREEPGERQPGIEAIDALVERHPLEVRLRVEGRVRAVPAGLGLAAYRIVQEALTNALKHAGKDAEADVVLRYGERALDITVVDDGAGRPPAPRRRSGHGLVNIAERAALFGGVSRAAPSPQGGFRVEATLPWM